MGSTTAQAGKAVVGRGAAFLCRTAAEVSLLSAILYMGKHWKGGPQYMPRLSQDVLRCDLAGLYALSHFMLLASTSDSILMH